MLLNLFNEMRAAKVPVSVRELLDLHHALQKGVVFADMDAFYYLARAILVKDERHFDKFDRAFAAYFKGLDNLDRHIEALIPEDWLRKEFERSLSDEERAQIQSLGGLDKLIEEFKKRLEEQKERHAGGNKWIGTGGTSPFGSGGFNPEGIRVGEAGKRQGKAVKVWDQREYKNLDDQVELGTRNIKLALRRLRKFAREGAAEELDIDGTIDHTARDAGAFRHLRPAAQVRRRLQSDLRWRRRHGPLRNHPAGWQRRALERRSRVCVDPALHGEVQEGHLDQPLPQAGLGLHGVNPPGARPDRGQDVSADLAGVGRRDALPLQVMYRQD